MGETGSVAAQVTELPVDLTRLKLSVSAPFTPAATPQLSDLPVKRRLPSKKQKKTKQVCAVPHQKACHLSPLKERQRP